MTIAEFVAIMDAIDLPHVYYSFRENAAPKLPYFVWYFEGSENMPADDEVYVEILSPVLELYTAEKSFETEKQVETVLNNSGIFWNKSETYLNSEKMFQVFYTLGDIHNG